MLYSLCPLKYAIPIEVTIVPIEICYALRFTIPTEICYKQWGIQYPLIYAILLRYAIPSEVLVLNTIEEYTIPLRNGIPMMFAIPLRYAVHNDICYIQ
jgi:hypothetical protein